MVTDKMRKCIKSVFYFAPPNIISYNKKTKCLKKTNKMFRWVCLSATIWGPLSGIFVLNLLLNVFVDKTLSTTLRCINIVLLLMSFVFAGISLTICHAILLHDNYFILLFNTISIFEPKFGKK